MSNLNLSPTLPRTPPFPFPRSTESPTFTSDSHSTSSSTAVHSSSFLSDADTPKASGRKDDTPIRKLSNNSAKVFGAGWMSSSSTSLPSLNLDSPPFLLPSRVPSRSRSPSMPNLPSQLQPRRHECGTTLPFGNCGATDASFYLPAELAQHTPLTTQPFPSPYILTPQSPHHELNPFQFPTNSDFERDNDQYHHTTLHHHQSVPDLPRLQPSYARRGSRCSVRFHGLDVLEDEDTSGEDDWRARENAQRRLRRMPGFHFGSAGNLDRNRLSSARSMPAMQMVGEGRNVYIHRVSSALGEQELREYASNYGEVVSLKIPPRTTRPHAFVMFKRPDQAQRFIAHLKSANIECEYGKEDYQVQNKALEDPNSANTYISGLPTDITFEELASLLAPGRICSWKPLVDELGHRRGPIMARLQTRPQAEEAIKRLNGVQYSGMSEKLQIRIADSEEQKHFKRQQGTFRDFGPPPVPGDQSLRRASMPGSMSSPKNDADISRLFRTREELQSRLLEINNRLALTSISPHSPTTHFQPTIFPSDPYASTALKLAMRCDHQDSRYASSDGSTSASGDWTGSSPREPSVVAGTTWSRQAVAPVAPLIIHNDLRHCDDDQAAHFGTSDPDSAGFLSTLHDHT